MKCVPVCLGQQRFVKRPLKNHFVGYLRGALRCCPNEGCPLLRQYAANELSSSACPNKYLIKLFFLHLAEVGIHLVLRLSGYDCNMMTQLCFRLLPAQHCPPTNMESRLSRVTMLFVLGSTCKVRNYRGTVNPLPAPEQGISATWQVYWAISIARKNKKRVQGFSHPISDSNPQNTSSS